MPAALKVLIVEDDHDIAALITHYLEKTGYAVETIPDGGRAIARARESLPDLVILDLMLPKLSGYDLCRRVRGEGFNAPILMLSARSQEGDRVVGLDLGANDYVTASHFRCASYWRGCGRCCVMSGNIRRYHVDRSEGLVSVSPR
jgi:two-component system response regulator ResD